MVDRLSLALLSAVALLFLSCERVPETKAQEQSTVAADDAASQEPVERVVEFEVERGNALVDLFLKAGLEATKAHECAVAFAKVVDPRSLIPQQRYRIVYIDGRPTELELELSRTRQAVIDLETLEARVVELETETVLKLASFEVASTLWEAAVGAELAPELIVRLADIFAWDIDFNVEIRAGDRFALVYEVKTLEDGERVGYGDILAAFGCVNGREHWAIRYECRGKEGYYDLDGRNLKKAFLKSPLRYRRISSGFTHRRLHPILRIVRPHLGIDYAAPAGTPVWAVGDGVVVYAGWKGGYGRFIEIRHNSVYSTTYGHLSRFARGIRRGARVRQGQVIGYVGATGLATGPHLDFRMKKHGRFVNPLREPNESLPPLPEECRFDFGLRAADMVALMTAGDEDALKTWYLAQREEMDCEGR